MEATELVESLRQLDTLAHDEYHVSLAEVIAQPGDNDERRLLRVGRLLGVILKEPFATPNKLKEPSRYSGAYRAWELDAKAFESTQSRWQYRALEALRSDPDVIQSLGGQLPTVYALADLAQGERGFFWYVAMSCRRYLCRDPKLRTRIDAEVQMAKLAGLDVRNITPEIIVASGGVTIGTVLVQNIPVLGIMGAPVIAGLVLIIYCIGIDAFCRWASDHESYHPDFPNPDKEEETPKTYLAWPDSGLKSLKLNGLGTPPRPQASLCLRP
jgi:hypothetical protein